MLWATPEPGPDTRCLKAWFQHLYRGIAGKADKATKATKINAPVGKVKACQKAARRFGKRNNAESSNADDESPKAHARSRKATRKSWSRSQLRAAAQ